MLRLKPTYLPGGTVEKLNLQNMWTDGVRGLILDLDNTIMRPRSGEFCTVVLPWLKQAQQLGFKLIIVTNNTNEKYLNSIASTLDGLNLPMITKAGKPRRGKLREALEYLELPAAEVCVIGDRVLTDVWGGVRLSMKTAFVEPLLGEQENVAYRFLRKLEKTFLNES